MVTPCLHSAEPLISERDRERKVRLAQKRIGARVIEAEDVLSALRWPLPEFRQVVDSRTIAVVLRLFLFLFFLFSSRVFSNPLLCEVIFSSLPARHRHRLAALLLFPDINYVPVGRTLRRWTHRCVSLTSMKGAPVLASLSLAVGVEIPV